ncbi:hypothetical protein RCL1_006828 [Eukaryota sp. TZLM3-RCL]
MSHVNPNRKGVPHPNDDSDMPPTIRQIEDQQEAPSPRTASLVESWGSHHYEGKIPAGSAPSYIMSRTARAHGGKSGEHVPKIEKKKFRSKIKFEERQMREHGED